ncbi:MAG: flippase-like domain-containing protein [Firmicutes bacterium]|nr:flippase-like domain-containing protein [Bacillota bacterium]
MEEKEEQEEKEEKKSNLKKGNKEGPVFLSPKVILQKTTEEADKIVQEKKEEIEATPETRIQRAAKEFGKRSGKTKRIAYNVFLVINVIGFIGILLWLYLSNGAYDLRVLFDHNVSSAIFLFLGAYFIFVLIMAFEVFRYWLLIYTSTKKSRIRTSYKTVSLALYYRLITPLRAGEYTYQIYYLYNNKVNASTATTLPTSRHVFEKITYLIVCILMLSFGFLIFRDQTTIQSFVTAWAYIALGFQLLIVIVIFILGIHKRFGEFLVITVMKFLKRFRIIKDYEEAFIRALGFAHEFNSTIKKSIANLPRFIYMFSSSVLILFLRLSVPFIIYNAFNGFGVFTFDVWLMTAGMMLICELAFGLWILPGHIVFADLVFISMFSGLFPLENGMMFWALLSWRFFSFYIFIIQGIAVGLWERSKTRLRRKAQTTKSLL